MIWDNPSARAALDVTGPLGTRVADTILVCGPVWPCEQTGHTNRIAPFTPPKKLLQAGGLHIRGPARGYFFLRGGRTLAMARTLAWWARAAPVSMGRSLPASR